MTPERWLRIKELFSDAVEMSADERALFLAKEAGDDAALVFEVNSLLRSNDTAGNFLADVPAELREIALRSETALAGERLGSYRLVEIIGTGGMGDVYKAVRDDDQYRAEVAIKIMRADMRNPLSEQRFRNERQILAALDHRNIARLLDGGTTTQGLPYVVMELVAGEPIDRYCDARSLSARDRVRLFLQVCAAVSFAHQHLVVHRDLKPNNILVTDDGSVKLLDFGIAKLIEPDAITGTNTEETRTQLRAMTLEYASPEQVSGGMVTTVSDVYSLGVVLYRLLTGQSPYGKRASNDAQRMAEILSDAAPTRPSQATHPDRRRDIDADLDNILLMALRKEPQRRYSGVEAMADDLRAYLSGLPVAARRGTFGYRMGKFTRRNKVPIAAAGLVAVSLVGGLGIAIREAHEAERQRVVAQRHFDSVRSLAGKLIGFHDEIKDLPGSLKARESLVKTSLEYLDTLYQEAGSDIALQEELGVAYRKIGDIQGNAFDSNRGDPKAALVSYGKSRALLEPLIKRNPANVKIGAFMAGTYYREAITMQYHLGPKEALPAAEKAVQYSKASRTGFESESLYIKQLVDSYAILSQTLTLLNRDEDARHASEGLIAISEEYSNAHPDDELGLRTLAKAYSNAANIEDSVKAPEQRFARRALLFKRALLMRGRLVALDPTHEQYRWDLALTQYNWGDALYEDGQYAAALEVFRKAAPALAKHDPNDARRLKIKAMNDVGIAKSLARTRSFAEAESAFARVEIVLKKLLKDSSGDIQLEFFLGQIGVNRGQMFADLAQAPRLTTGERSNYWRKARDALRDGVAYFKSVNNSFALVGGDKDIWDSGLATLAKAEAALVSPS